VVAEGQLGGRPVLERHHLQLLQPRPFGPRERRVGEVGQDRPTPQRQALGQHRGRPLVLAGLQPPVSLGGQRLEPRGVQVLGGDHQPVAGGWLSSTRAGVRAGRPGSSSRRRWET